MMYLVPLKRCLFLLSLFFFLPTVAQAHIITRVEELPMRDGTTLHTLAILPSENGAFPILVLFTPYPFADQLIEQETALAVPFGIGVVTQYIRGTHKSKGEDKLLEQAQQDAIDTITWIRKQEWCNGTVSVMGQSLQGIVAMMAAQADLKLTSQLIWFAAPSLYDTFFTQGVFRPSLTPKALATETLPATLTAIKRPNVSDNPFWKARSAKQWDKVSAATLLLGGWFGTHTQDILDTFVAHQTQSASSARGKHKLIIGPWSHDTYAKEKQGDLTFPASAKKVAGMDAELFMEEWLLAYPLDTPGGLKRTLAPVNYYLMGDTSATDAPGNKWIRAGTWPPPNTPKTLYLADQQALSEEKPTAQDQSKTFTFDPENPVPTKGGSNLKLPSGPTDQASLESRDDVLTFTSKTLDAPLTVVGKIQLTLWVATDAKDTDFTAKLTDVYPDGRSILILDGIVRLRHRNTTTKEEFVTPNTPTEVTLTLGSTAIVFNKGHKLRLTISSSNAPRFQPNPNTDAPLSLEKNTAQKAQNTLYFDAKHPSSITLPIVDVDALPVYEAPPPEPTPPAEPTPSETTVQDGSSGDASPSESKTDAAIPGGTCGCNHTNTNHSTLLWFLLLLLLLLPRKTPNTPRTFSLLFKKSRLRATKNVEKTFPSTHNIRKP